MQLDENWVGVESWHREEGAGSLRRVGGGHRADRLVPQLCVQDNYRNNPFHNFRHCFCVAQMMYSMIWCCRLQVGLGASLLVGSLGRVWGASLLVGSLGRVWGASLLVGKWRA